MAYLHGVETFEAFTGPVPVSGLPSGAIGLVGTAPILTVLEDDRTVNELVLCTSEADDAKYFGVPTTGYSIPDALKAMRAQGAGRIFVVNVFDPETHLDEDDEPDPAEVIAADIIGTVDGDGIRTGMQAWLDARAQNGYGPRILVAPGFSSTATVAAALRVIAPKLRAINLVDAAVGTTVAAAIAGRTGVGHVFNTAGDRSLLCYPHLKAAGPGGEITLQPMSQFLAGVIAAKDLRDGYWHSPSNSEFLGVTGVERLLTASLSDSSTEVQQLNEQGIITYFPQGGIRVWGNESAAFPTETTVNRFVCVRRTADLIEDAIEAAEFQFADKPLTTGIIDTIVGMVNGFLGEKRGEGAILAGRCWFDPADNDLTKLAAGNATYRYDFLPPPPMQRITNRAVINTEYLSGLVGGGA